MRTLNPFKRSTSQLSQPQSSPVPAHRHSTISSTAAAPSSTRVLVPQKARAILGADDALFMIQTSLLEARPGPQSVAEAEEGEDAAVQAKPVLEPSIYSQKWPLKPLILSTSSSSSTLASTHRSSVQSSLRSHRSSPNMMPATQSNTSSHGSTYRPRPSYVRRRSRSHTPSEQAQDSSASESAFPRPGDRINEGSPARSLRRSAALYVPRRRSVSMEDFQVARLVHLPPRSSGNSSLATGLPKSPTPPSSARLRQHTQSQHHQRVSSAISSSSSSTTPSFAEVQAKRAAFYLHTAGEVDRYIHRPISASRVHLTANTFQYSTTTPPISPRSMLSNDTATSYEPLSTASPRQSGFPTTGYRFPSLHAPSSLSISSSRPSSYSPGMSDPTKVRVSMITAGPTRTPVACTEPNESLTLTIRAVTGLLDENQVTLHQFIEGDETVWEVRIKGKAISRHDSAMQFSGSYSQRQSSTSPDTPSLASSASSAVSISTPSSPSTSLSISQPRTPLTAKSVNVPFSLSNSLAFQHVRELTSDSAYSSTSARTDSTVSPATPRAAASPQVPYTPFKHGRVNSYRPLGKQPLLRSDSSTFFDHSEAISIGTSNGGVSVEALCDGLSDASLHRRGSRSSSAPNSSIMATENGACTPAYLDAIQPHFTPRQFADAASALPYTHARAPSSPSSLLRRRFPQDDDLESQFSLELPASPISFRTTLSGKIVRDTNACISQWSESEAGSIAEDGADEDDESVLVEIEDQSHLYASN